MTSYIQQISMSVKRVCQAAISCVTIQLEATFVLAWMDTHSWMMGVIVLVSSLCSLLCFCCVSTCENCSHSHVSEKLGNLYMMLLCMYQYFYRHWWVCHQQWRMPTWLFQHSGQLHLWVSSWTRSAIRWTNLQRYVYLHQSLLNACNNKSWKLKVQLVGQTLCPLNLM